MTVEIPPLYRMAYRLGHHPSQIDPDVLVAYMDKVDGRRGRIPETAFCVDRLPNYGENVESILRVLASRNGMVKDIAPLAGLTTARVSRCLHRLKEGGKVMIAERHGRAVTWAITAQGRKSLLEGME